MALAQSRVSLGQLRIARDSLPQLIPLLSIPPNEASHCRFTLLGAPITLLGAPIAT